jgi:hypothetical protein
MLRDMRGQIFTAAGIFGGALTIASTQNHKSLSRRPLTRRWWTWDLVHTNGRASLL